MQLRMHDEGHLVAAVCSMTWDASGISMRFHNIHAACVCWTDVRYERYTIKDSAW